jgi:hypothetical protein
LVVGLGCGEKQATPPEGSGLAGTVLTVEGEVAAARPAAAARRLSPDAEVFADDSVTAAAGAAVEIALRHNGVVWRLEGGGEGLTRRLVDSAA